jgi:hypothetical protein
MPAGGTLPAKRPDRSIRGSRFYCAACKTSPPGYGHAVHAARAPIAPMGGPTILRDFIIE